MTDWRERQLDDLLAEHGLDGVADTPFPTDGWSGATFRLLERDGERFILKHSSPANDWIVRATRDDGIREAWLAGALAPRARLTWRRRISARRRPPMAGRRS